jgi:hypothetical protein
MIHILVVAMNAMDIWYSGINARMHWVNVAMVIGTLVIVDYIMKSLSVGNACVRNDGYIPFNMNNSWKW